MDWTPAELKAWMNYHLREMKRLMVRQEKVMERIEEVQEHSDYDAEIVFLKELTELLKKINSHVQDFTETVRLIREGVGDEREAEEA